MFDTCFFYLSCTYPILVVGEYNIKNDCGFKKFLFFLIYVSMIFKLNSKLFVKYIDMVIFCSACASLFFV